ncbi:MAG TPA: hypothetical protein VFA45_20130 [Actinomycetes bacterium]|jgi:hypothetical protein|nr:hypothetical protein [Actinomycetes bacterium]
MTGEPTAGIDRFTRRLRSELVDALYPQHDAQRARAAEAHSNVPARRRPSWRRRLVVALTVAGVAAGLTVAPSLIRGGTGATDALAVTTLPDGRVKVDMPRDFTDSGPLAARLRPYGVNVTVQRCTPPVVRPDVGRIVGALGFGPIGFGAWEIKYDQNQKPRLPKAPMVQRPGAGRFTLILDPNYVRSVRRRGQVGWLYVFVGQATPQAKPVLEPAIFRFRATTATPSRHPGPACLAGTSTTR